MEQYICKVCGHVYDPAYGAPELGIDPGIPFETLPDDWNCPKCHSAKTEFEPQTGPMPGMAVPVGT